MEKLAVCFLPSLCSFTFAAYAYCGALQPLLRDDEPNDRETGWHLSQLPYTYAAFHTVAISFLPANTLYVTKLQAFSLP